MKIDAKCLDLQPRQNDKFSEENARKMSNIIIWLEIIQKIFPQDSTVSKIYLKDVPIKNTKCSAETPEEIILMALRIIY